MRYLVLIALLLALGGCSTKNIRVGGMICPEGHSDQMISRDFLECRAYDEKAAQKASWPKKVPSECFECLEERGYKIGE